MSARKPKPNGRPRALMLALAAAAVAGCTTVGPDYQRPALALDSGFVGAGTSALDARQPAEDIATFWRGFGDPKLNALIERAVVANGDIRLAQGRLLEARAGQDEAEAALRPGVGLDTSATRAIRPLTQQPGTSRSTRTGNTFDASFLAQWELDLFGRLRRGSEAATALSAAGQAQVHAAQTSVAAEVARNYLELRGLQLRLQVTVVSLANQRESLGITQARVEAGRGTQLDLARAQSLVASTEAALPALQTAAERAIFRLATLTAQAPRALLAELSPATPMTGLPALPVTDLAKLPVGTPEQWLQRRPDVIAAERQLAASTALIGVARGELYPRLSLSGLLGLNAASLSSLGRGEAARYSLGAGLSWTPFDLGAIRSRIRASEARAQQSLVGFEQAVAVALEETEGAFSSYTRSAERAEKLEAAARSADEAAGLARARYEAGVSDFLPVLDAEREALGYRDQWVQAQVGTATSLVAVYRALGGGWRVVEVTQAAN
jgi:multidrug efflux system outer membrane protein